MRTSPAPGTGSGTSWSARTSVPPLPVTMTAFMPRLLRGRSGFARDGGFVPVPEREVLDEAHDEEDRDPKHRRGHRGREQIWHVEPDRGRGEHVAQPAALGYVLT